MDDDIFKWSIVVVGTAGTPLEGGFFNAVLEFPQDYPQNPPTMKFTSDMYHPNSRSRHAPVGRRPASFD